jgi:hypothetical protein
MVPGKARPFVQPSTSDYFELSSTPGILQDTRVFPLQATGDPRIVQGLQIRPCSCGKCAPMG